MASHRLIAGLLMSLLLLCATLGTGATVRAQEPPLAPAAVTAPASQPAFVPLSGIVAIAAGGDHTCALTTTGGVKCWGRDDYGQVGDGPDAGDKLTPVDVVGLSSGVTAIAAGDRHTCALTVAGGVKCWGADGVGQVGDGADGSNKLTPVDVVGLASGVTAIASGGGQTCALTVAGGVKCWGFDANGQLGDGVDGSNKLTPVDVAGLASGVTAIAAGYNHTCALTVAGGVKCWGFDGFGQVGDGADANSKLTPVDVVGLSSGVTAIAAGQFNTCALTVAGGVKCWGADGAGQVGDGADASNKLTPVDVVGLASGVTAIASGGLHTCALTVAGGVKCWGADGVGQVGDGTDASNKLTPVDVVGLTNSVKAIAAGLADTCALTTAGGVKCWGSDTDGQLGDGMNQIRSLPGDVLVPQTCFKLTRSATGSGDLPTPAAIQSAGCPLNHYLSGTQVVLTASPGAGSRVQSWGVATGTAGSLVGVLNMPAADTTLTVVYASCRTLTVSHTGSGGNPAASPPNSPGCVVGKYAAGESIVLVAVPAASQRVKAWTGAGAAPATGSQVNTLTMPNADASVKAAYEACFALTATVVGQGQIGQVSPASSAGCVAASTYAAGERVALTANPAAGFAFAGWSGGATGSANPLAVTVTGPLTINAIFKPVAVGSVKLFLPAVKR